MPRHNSTQGPAQPGAAEDQSLLNPYQVLQIERQATIDEIKKAYFEQVRRYPPEREPVMFKRIRTAYDALRTPEARAATDLFLLHPPEPYESYRRAPSFNLAFDPADRAALAEAYSDTAQVDFRRDYRDIPL